MKKSKIAILGSGPAGLMAATVVAEAGHEVHLFEKKKGPGKKLLIAGTSGLNITHDAPLESFHEFYRSHSDFLKRTLQTFTPANWISFIEKLGIKTFLGSSRRYFVEGLKASGLLKAWLEKLEGLEVRFYYQHELTALQSEQKGVTLEFNQEKSETFDAVCLALGGASYEPQERPLRWPKILTQHGLQFVPFVASNVGYEVNWSSEFIKEVEGQPLKNITLLSHEGNWDGDLMVTRYGLEGTPIYSLAQAQRIHLDLKPSLTLTEILKKLQASQENLSPIRRIKKYLNLSPVALAILYHETPEKIRSDLNQLAQYIKRFPIELIRPRPIEEAISSSGGLALEELNASLMIKKLPGVFVAGEMLNWDAPTGGFLIQACASQGYCAGKAMLIYLFNLHNQ